MNTLRNHIFGAWLILTTVNSVHAREYFDIFPTPYGRAMGGAVSALVDDHNSLFYNPAGLALIETESLRMPDLLMGYASPSIRTLFVQLMSLGSAGGGTSGITSALSTLDRVGASAGFDLLGMGWYQPKMGIHLNVLSTQLGFRVRTPSLLFSKIQARATADSGVSLGFARGFFGNQFRVGVTVRPFHLRGGLSQSYEGLEILELQNIQSLLGFGWGFDADVGFQGHNESWVVLGFPIRLGAGFVVQNILENSFSKRLSSSVATLPPGTDRRYNLGFSATVKGIEKMKPSVSVEFRDLGVGADSWLEYLSLAFEFKFLPKTWFHSIMRGHLYKGQIGGGIAGKLWFGELEIGTYAVSMGRGVGVGVDRRLYVQLSSVF